MKNLTKKILALLMVLVMMLSLGVSAFAEGEKDIYVSASGSDETGDGTASNPYATIKKAYDASGSGDTIILLSDIAQSECVSIWHDLTIKSEDSATYTVTRQSGFASTSDTARSWYNPAMFEVHPDDGGTWVTFANIILDDNLLHEGTSYTDQPTAPADTSANLTRVQDGIISLYNDPANTYKCTVVLENGAELHNFGGVNGVNIEGNSELIMAEGSVISGGINKGIAASGVLALSGGRLTMQPGSLITGINGSNAVLANNGYAEIGGEITACYGTSPIRAATGTIDITSTGNLHDNSGWIYSLGPCTFYIDGKIHDWPGDVVRPSGNGGNATVYITDNAEIYNCPGIAVKTDIITRVFMSGGSIHDCGTGVLVRKQAHFTMTGGTITANGKGINLSSDSTSTARAFVNAGSVTGNTNDYYVESTQLGYMNRSYMYFSGEQLATAPKIDMQTNAKSILPTTDNSELYLGNASAGGNSAINGYVVDGTENGGQVLATWFAKAPESSLRLIVAGLAAQDADHDVYVVSFPVDADGVVTGGEIVHKVVKDYGSGSTDLIVETRSDSEYGRAYGLFVYNKIYDVIFDSQEGSSVPTQGVKENETAVKPDNPTRRTYHFAGWYTDDTFTTEYDFSTPVTQDITLYAKWERTEYDNDVDLSDVTITKNVNSVAEVPETQFQFKTERISIDPNFGSYELTDMPDLGTLSVTVPAGGTAASVALPTAVHFPIGGVYTYKITEINDGKDNWTYDESVYYLELEVEENASGDLQLDKVVIHKGSETGEKSDLSFTNTYAPPTTLTVAKTVKAEEDNPLNKTKEFQFSITFNKPAVVPEGKIKAFAIGTDAEGGETKTELDEFDYGEAYSFTLKNGESIRFENLAVGATYTLTEAGEEYYTPSAKVVEGGTEGETSTGTYNEDLTVTGQAKEGNNRVDYTNTYSITPPTGITIRSDMLVVAGLLIVAVIGGFIMNRKLRKLRG